MKNIGIQLIQSLSNREITKFSRFINSSYFNTDQTLVALWVAVKKHIIQKKGVEKEWQVQLFVDLYKVKRKDKKHLEPKEKTLLTAKMSLLIELLREFLMIEALKNKSAIKIKILSEVLLERKQLDMHQRQIKKEMKIIENEKIRNIQHYEYAYNIHEAHLNYLHQKRLLLKENNIELVNFNMNMQYLLEKLKLYSTSLSLNRVNDKQDFHFPFMDAIQQLVHSPDYITQPLILIHSTVIKLMQSDKEQYYMQLLKLLDKYELEISVEDLDGFYTVASNFCISKILKGELQYNRRLFELYKLVDSKNLLTQDNLMDIGRFKNIVGLSCRMKDFKWAEQLIKKYESIFRHKDKKSVAHFNLGTIAFYQSDFNKAIHHFIRVKKIDTAYDANNRMMLIKTHFELDEEYDERTVRIFRTTGRFIVQHRILNSKHKKGFKNFIRLLHKIYRFKFGNRKTDINKIITEINTLDFISDKKWLLDKAENIKKSIN